MTTDPGTFASLVLDPYRDGSADENLPADELAARSWIPAGTAAERIARVSDLRPSASAARSSSRTHSDTLPERGAPSNAACGASPNPPGVSGSDAS